MKAESRLDMVLELDQFCIETTARRRYQRLVDEVLGGDGPASEAEEELGILKVFLEQMDFSAIRTAHEELSGGHRVRVRIWLDGDGRADWSVL